jgi:hypothetical protein
MNASLYFKNKKGEKILIGKLLSFTLQTSNRSEAQRVISHNPDRDRPWWLAFHPEKGCIGRIRWFNSDQEEGTWGRVFFSRNP